MSDSLPSSAALPRNLAGLDLAGLFAAASSGKEEAGKQNEVLTAEELSLLLPAFEVESLIGAGGMGAVYRARHRTLDRRVALKVLPPEISADAALAERFRREAQTLARLQHPNIVSLMEFGVSGGGHLFFTMELLEGGDLAARLRSGNIEPAEALRWLREICAALEYAHGQGVIHRDVKPSNVLLTTDGHVKVADFGLAVLQQRGATPKLTKSGVAVGTLEYAAPEQLAGDAEKVDARSDVYSLGVLAYEMLTGEVPRGVFKPPSQLRPGLGGGFDAAITRAMRQDPAERFPSPAAFRRELEKSPPPRNRWPWATAAALLAMGAGIYWKSGGDAPQPANASSTPPVASSANVFNGHAYQLIRLNLKWSEARDMARRMGAELAAITSQEEQIWVQQSFLRPLPNGRGFWLGGMRDAAGQWTWTSGEPFAFTAWLKDEGGDPAESAVFMVAADNFPDMAGWMDRQGDGRTTAQSGPLAGQSRLAGFLVEWNDAGVANNSDAWKPVFDRPEHFGQNAADYGFTDGWIVMTHRNLIPPQQIGDGAFRATLRYHRDTASLTARYSGRNQPSCSAFITSEGTQAALTIAADESMNIASDRLQFPLPRPLREGDAYTLELGAIGDLLFLNFDGERIGSLLLPPHFPATGLMGLNPASQRTPAEVKDMAWRIILRH